MQSYFKKWKAQEVVVKIIDLLWWRPLSEGNCHFFDWPGKFSRPAKAGSDGAVEIGHIRRKI